MANASHNNQFELVQLRLATTNDVVVLEELVQLAYRGGKSKISWKNEHDLVEGPRITIAALREQIECKSNHILVLENGLKADPALLGCVKVIHRSEDEAYLGMLAVHPNMQDQGLGKRLLQTAEQFAYDKLHCRRIKMSVLSARKDLLAWYKRCGYTATGEKEGFFPPESGQIAKYADAHFVVIAKNL